MTFLSDPGPPEPLQSAFTPDDHRRFARLVHAAFEREFWSRRYSRPYLISSALSAAVDLLLPHCDPPAWGPTSAGADHPADLLHWQVRNIARSDFHQLLRALQDLP
ncbi:hypothetical protein KBZ18_10070 [Synechococcus sp. Cruz-9H2]|uniref:hypothetical protein n=1 Tax=unclassified Synechococcus TaxID=2626047 RepID=UPI0020CDC666|nr:MULTISPECIES: hypothetical protein [unclassified Synechococcus]MCP9819838.1 hypothetical protein [Synechococcus sp. Cruz-9H2]MCP9844096.1 hypothetical protein [Synechococcus sp. Edmonson 11F2]MCP9856268.1 hypothetical protein [Synechococcus sp. Cruz-9C9]MCP9863553.1 hypothetical protein [Synechococcus sp. Cruz-7E5]MCP9870749.1 hypothetical protein [Synechococcus sp. Cruz-7B9]